MGTTSQQRTELVMPLAASIAYGGSGIESLVGNPESSDYFAFLTDETYPFNRSGFSAHADVAFLFRDQQEPEMPIVLRNFTDFALTSFSAPDRLLDTVASTTTYHSAHNIDVLERMTSVYLAGRRRSWKLMEHRSRRVASGVIAQTIQTNSDSATQGDK